MSNVISIAGDVPTERFICQMAVGEIGYTVPWAYDHESGYLDDETFTVSPKGGTCSLRIECIKPRQYALVFETSHWQSTEPPPIWKRAAMRFQAARLKLAQQRRANNGTGNTCNLSM